MPLGDEAERRYGAPYWSIHRADLQAALLEAVRANPDIVLRLGTRVEDFVVHANGLSVACRRGSATADEHGIALIGADGLWSGLRARLGHPAAGIPPAHRLAGARSRGQRRAKNSAPPTCSSGSGRNAHVVHYPVKSGTAHQHRRHRQRQLGGARLERGRPARRAAGALLAVELGEPVREFLAVPERWQKWALYDLPPLSTWGDGPVTLLGDAAHPMLPFLAQGAAMAIEDAAILADSMARLPDDPASRDAALRARAATAHGAGAARRRAAMGGSIISPRARRGRAICFCGSPAERCCCAATIGFMIGARRRREAPCIPAPCPARTPAKTKQRKRSSCFRPPSQARCRNRPGSPSPTSCGRSGGSPAPISPPASSTPRLLAVKLQEDAGIDVVTDGEQSRQHFVHGFLEFVDGIDFANKVEMGIRNDRYKAMVPTVTGALKLKGRVHGSRGASRPRPHQAQAQDHHAGADDHHRHHRRPALRRPREDGVRLRRPAQRRGARARSRRRRRDPVRRAGVQRLHERGRGPGASRRCTAPSPGSTARPPCTSATATASRPTSTGRRRSAASGGSTRRFSRRWRRAGSPKCRSSASTPRCRRICCRCSRARTFRSASSTWRATPSRRRRMSPPPSRPRSSTCRKERIIAGTNCGMAPMRRDIAVAKLDALGRGAALARQRFS